MSALLEVRRLIRPRTTVTTRSTGRLVTVELEVIRPTPAGALVGVKPGVRLPVGVTLTFECGTQSGAFVIDESLDNDVTSGRFQVSAVGPFTEARPLAPWFAGSRGS